MPWFHNTTYLRLIDSLAIIIAHAYQLALSRLASASSPVMRAMLQRNLLFAQIKWLKREQEIQRTDQPGTSASPTHHRGVRGGVT